MQNINAASIPKFHVLSNGATVFAARIILFTGKWIELFTGTVLAFNLQLQHIGLTYGKRKCTIRKNLNFCLTAAIRFYNEKLFVHDLCS
jgi:hypothetical protein